MIDVLLPTYKINTMLNKKLFTSVILYWIVVSTIAVLVYPVLISDTMNRYAPMADAFAAGDWFHAFHPRFGVLFQILTGTLAWFGLRGDQACQVVAIGFLAASAIPAWYLMRRVFDEKVASITAALILLMPEYFVFAIDGLRDTARTFAALMIAYSFVSFKRSWVMAIGVFVMASLRTDMQFVAILAVIAWTVMAIRRQAYKEIVCPILALLVGLLACSIMVYAYTGIFLPNAHAVNYLGGAK